MASAVLAVACPAWAATDEDRAVIAVQRYDSGDYAGARELLEALHAEGRLDGPMLYRLAFSRGATGDLEGRAQAEAEALARLETAHAAAGSDLEVAFYLANAYRNAGRSGDALRVASQTTSAFDRGDHARPSDPTDQFRLGKLYEDQGLTDRSTRWYTEALAVMDREPDRYAGYRRWGHRHIGDVAFGAADYGRAAAEYRAAAETRGATADDWDRAAVAAGRLGRWSEAEQAWRTAETLDPAKADRARYCRRLAAIAVELGSLPLVAPDGRAYRELSRDDLERLMKEQAQAVDAALAELRPDESIPPEMAQGLQARLDASKPVFVAAALEYALRGLPIRETAFVGGYAPLIFQPSRWQVPAAG